MASKKIYGGICAMMRRENGATAIEIQYKYKLSFADTIYYILKAQSEHNVLKNGCKLKILNSHQSPQNHPKNQANIKKYKI